MRCHYREDSPIWLKCAMQVKTPSAIRGCALAHPSHFVILWHTWKSYVQPWSHRRIDFGQQLNLLVVSQLAFPLNLLVLLLSEL